MQNRILAVANQKGGVGKTTTAINLATALASIGEEVLLIDLDPQGNASTGLGLSLKDRFPSSFDVLLQEAELADAIKPTSVPNVKIIPAVIDLLGAEVELAARRNKAYHLKEALTRYAQGNFNRPHYILIDCPPSLNLLTINALTAADAILVPLQCEFYALEGLSQLLTTIEHVKKTLNSRLIIHGVVLTMFDQRNSLANQVVADVRHFLGDQVYKTVIPRNVRISEAPSYGKPVLLYDLKCAGSQAYLRLASEIIERERILCVA